MNKKLIDALIKEIHPQSILRSVSTFWGFRSTVPGPGLRAASEFLVNEYRDIGLQADLLSYLADDRTEYLDGHKHPLCWSPHSATLEIVEPKEFAGALCSFAEEPLCLISNSTGTTAGGMTAEVIIVNPGTRPEDYAGLDVSGKIIFVDAWPHNADELARVHGAAGLITDSVTPPWLKDHPPVRQRSDVPDLTMWGTLDGHRKEHPLWGFSLSPRQGAYLRKIIHEAKSPVFLHATIDASLAEGRSDLVTAVLPGNDLADEEIWILSHSSEPGALDNASGCCASVEIARVLMTLTQSGALPPLRRTIRFLSAVETEGYLPYISEHFAGLSKVKAALAFDSIGSDSRQSGGTLRLGRSPDYNPSFADDLLENILVVVAAEANSRFTSDNYDLFPWQADPCFPGNDNFLADGLFDIPTPMLFTWPDKFYHSNLDTPDKLNHGSLARCTTVASAYLYYLATAGRDEILEMANLTLQAWKRRMVTLGTTQPATDRILQTQSCVMGGIDALRSLLRIESSIGTEIEEMENALLEFLHLENKVVTDQSAEWKAALKISEKRSGPHLKPNRWQPPALDSLSADGKKRFEALRDQYPKVDETWWLINGHRTASDICARSMLPEKIILVYLDILLKENVISAR